MTKVLMFEIYYNLYALSNVKTINITRTEMRHVLLSLYPAVEYFGRILMHYREIGFYVYFRNLHCCDNANLI